MLAHRDPEGVECIRRRVVRPFVPGEVGISPVEGSISSATFGGQFGRGQPTKQDPRFQS